MTAISLGLIIEVAVAILLVLTIVYCVILNNRLRSLHADRESLKQMVADLVRATDMANSAIKGLREAATEADTTLNTRLAEADRFAIELANHVNAGRTIMDRIARVTDTVRRSGPSTPNITAPTPAVEKGAQAALDRLAAHQRRRENVA